MAVGSKKEFIECLRNSQILGADKVKELVEEYPTEDLGEFVRQLVRGKVLTAWQAKFLYSGRHQLKLENYVLLERIKRDELGDRFLANNVALNRNVEIQILPPEVSDNPQLQKTFISHASVISELDHPHLSHIQDVDKSGGRFYLIDERRTGEPLGEIQPTADELVACTNQILQALAFAHSHGVAHGEVITDNVLRVNPGQFKICGIGLPFMRRQLAGLDPSTARDDMLAFAKIMKSEIERLKPEAKENLRWLSDCLDSLADDPISAYPHVVVATDKVMNRWSEDRFTPPVETDPAPTGPATNAIGLGAEIASPVSSSIVSKPPASSPPKPRKKSGASAARRPNPILMGAAGLVALGMLAVAIVLATGALNGPEDKSTADKETGDNTTNVSPTVADSSRNDNKNNRPSRTENSDPPQQAVVKKPDDVPPASDDIDPDDAKPSETTDSKPDSQLADDRESKQEEPKQTGTPTRTANAPKKFSAADIAAALAETEGANGEKAVPIDTSPRTEPKTTETPTQDPAIKTLGNRGPQEYFAGIPTTFALAGTDVKENMVLGELAEDEKITDLKLIYELSAFQGGKGGFLLKANGESTWDLQLLARQDKTEGTVVGQFQHLDGSLQFTWSKRVSKHSPANALRNCILQVSSGDTAKEIALREPVEFTIQLTEEAYRQKIKTDADWLPQAAFIGVEVAKPVDPWPRRVYIEEGEEFPDLFHFDNEHSPLAIYFDRDENKQYLSVVVKPLAEKSLSFQVGVFGRGKKTEPVEFENYESLNRAINLIEQAKLAKGVQSEQAKIVADNAPFGQRGKTRDRANDIRREHETLKENFDISTDIREQLEELHNARLKFNVYYQLGSRRVIIARSSDN